MIKQMHPLKKATIKELFPVLSIIVHGTCDSQHDNTISESQPTFSDRSHFDKQRLANRSNEQKN